MNDYDKFIESMRALAFIRGYVRAAMTLKNDQRTAQLLSTIEKKATQGLIASGIEIEAKVSA